MLTAPPLSPDIANALAYVERHLGRPLTDPERAMFVRSIPTRVTTDHLDAALWIGGESRALVEAYLEWLGYTEADVELALDDYVSSCPSDAIPCWAPK